MAQDQSSRISEILAKHDAAIVAEWMAEQQNAVGRQGDLMRDSELREQCRELIALLRQATAGGDFTNIHRPEWEDVRAMLARVSRSRALQGFTPTETAMFVFSLKQPLLNHLRTELQSDTEALLRENTEFTALIDQLGLWTFESFLKAREEVIARQQQELLELSTPVVKLWDGVLALPLIGTLDSARTQVVMESLLQRIVDTGSEIAIIDITGVPTVDTLVAQHLLKTVTAARLMGAECIISGIRPQIAQTIVHLGVDLENVMTKSNLADAFAVALKRNGVTLQKIGAPRQTLRA